MVLILVASVALYCIVVVGSIGIGTVVVQKHTERTVQMVAVEVVLVQEILVWVTMLHME